VPPADEDLPDPLPGPVLLLQRTVELLGGDPLRGEEQLPEELPDPGGGPEGIVHGTELPLDGEGGRQIDRVEDPHPDERLPQLLVGPLLLGQSLLELGPPTEDLLPGAGRCHVRCWIQTPRQGSGERMIGTCSACGDKPDVGKLVIPAERQRKRESSPEVRARVWFPLSATAWRE